MKRERKLLCWFKYGEDKYISLRSIERVTADGTPVNERTFKGYLNKVRAMVGYHTFTVKKLRNEGLTDLDALGFDSNQFIEYLLETEEIHMNSLKTSNDSTIKIFSYFAVPTLGDMICQIVEPVGFMDISDVKEELERVFGAEISTPVIIRSVKKTDLYYEETIEKVYVTKEDLRRYAHGDE